MTADKIKSRISETASHFTFDFNNKACGVDPFTATKFNMWCGDNNITVNSIDDVMNHPFFDGKCLTDICNDITIIDF